MNFAVATQVEPRIADLRCDAVHSLGPDLAVSNERVMTDVIHPSFAATVLPGALAGLAVLLAELGIYAALDSGWHGVQDPGMCCVPF
jgi:hypothetical protein